MVTPPPPPSPRERAAIQKDRSREKGKEDRVSKGRGGVLTPHFFSLPVRAVESIAAKWALEMEAALYVPSQSSQSWQAGGGAVGPARSDGRADMELNNRLGCVITEQTARPGFTSRLLDGTKK